ncbi:MAG TPA: DUF6702 family protein [Chitinophagaceae bacterium]|nr:DUF6702 family protein [Chitinophagaceae bacterium]
MASSFYKWLLIPVLGIVLSSAGLPKLHPFHVSVVEINHNATDKTLEISCKIFTDDFEKVLAQNYKTKVDLTNPPDRKAMDSVVKKYIFSHISIAVDGKPGTLSYVGFEKDNEAVYCYVEIDNIPSVKKVELTDKLMHDMFTDQVNIIHVIVKGERKSTKLDYPETVAKIEF